MPHRLSKSRYTAGAQCHKLLWWKVHEPNALELQPDKVLQDRFDQGAQVGALARGRFPGGVLIDLPHRAVTERVALTRELIDDGAPAIFEASFLADHTFVAVDVLAPNDRGFHLTEVKSSSSQKEEHLPDAAVQVHVLEQSGIRITGVDVMHLNKECHFPDLSNLFERTDVTAAVQPLLGKVGWEIDALLQMLEHRLAVDPSDRLDDGAGHRLAVRDDRQRLHGSPAEASRPLGVECAMHRPRHLRSGHELDRPRVALQHQAPLAKLGGQHLCRGFDRPWAATEDLGRLGHRNGPAQREAHRLERGGEILRFGIHRGGRNDSSPEDVDDDVIHRRAP